MLKTVSSLKYDGREVHYNSGDNQEAFKHFVKHLSLLVRGPNHLYTLPICRWTTLAKALSNYTRVKHVVLMNNQWNGFCTHILIS